MSYGTSDTTVISSTKTEAHNLNTIIAFAETKIDGCSSANWYVTFFSRTETGFFKLDPNGSKDDLRCSWSSYGCEEKCPGAVLVFWILISNATIVGVTSPCIL